MNSEQNELQNILTKLQGTREEEILRAVQENYKKIA